MTWCETLDLWPCPQVEPENGLFKFKPITCLPSRANTTVTCKISDISRSLNTALNFFQILMHKFVSVV